MSTYVAGSGSLKKKPPPTVRTTAGGLQPPPQTAAPAPAQPRAKTLTKAPAPAPAAIPKVQTAAPAPAPPLALPAPPAFGDTGWGVDQAAVQEAETAAMWRRAGFEPPPSAAAAAGGPGAPGQPAGQTNPYGLGQGGPNPNGGPFNLTGDPVKDAFGLLASQAQGQLPNQDLFMERLAGFFDPSRLDPANDPTMAPFLDAMRQEAARSQTEARDLVGDQFAGSGMYGSSLRALESGKAVGDIDRNLQSQMATTLFGTRQQALQQQMEALGLQGSRDVDMAGYNQQAASQLGGLGLQREMGYADINAQNAIAQMNQQAANAGAGAQLQAAMYGADIERDLGMRGYDVQELLGLRGYDVNELLGMGQQDVALQLGFAGLDSQNFLGAGQLDLQRELGLRGLSQGAAGQMLGGDLSRLGMMGGLGNSLAQQGMFGGDLLSQLLGYQTNQYLGAGQLGGIFDTNQAHLGAANAAAGANRYAADLGNNQFNQNMAYQQQQFAEQQRAQAFNEYIQLLLGAGGAFGQQHTQGTGTPPAQPQQDPWMAGIMGGLGGYLGAGGNFGAGGGMGGNGFGNGPDVYGRQKGGPSNFT